jgi:hypothetical protein
MEYTFSGIHNTDIDYLKKVTEEDNTQGTVNYHLTHDGQKDKQRD